MLSILLVEDEPHIRFVVRKVLESAGHTVSEAGDGLEGLHILRKRIERFGLIVLDVDMPKMNGFEFLDQLNRQPFRVPVLMLTAYRNYYAKAETYGAIAYLTKPFNRARLVELVNRVVYTPAPELSDRLPASSYPA